MRCDEFEKRLNELLDRRIAPDDDAALCSHARRCSPCADFMEATLTLTAAVRQLPRKSPDETFPLAVMNRMEGERNVATRRRRQQWTIASVATAAAVLIALTLWRGGVTLNAPADPTNHLATSSDLPPGYERFAQETQQLASLIATRQLEVMNELAEGIRPVASSFGAAYDALRRTLPSTSTPQGTTSG